jgi:hypothetical protein
MNAFVTDMKSLCPGDYVIILTLVWKMLSRSSAACTTEGAESTVKSITGTSDMWLADDFEELKCLGTNPGSLISSRTLAWYTGGMGSVTNPLGTPIPI